MCRPRPYDLAKAKALVAEAGPGARAEIELATAPVFDQRIVQAIQQMLVEAGLNVKIKMADMASYLKRSQARARGNLHAQLRALVLRLPGRRRHPLPAASQEQRLVAYRNPKADKLLEEARQTLDKDKRLALTTGPRNRRAGSAARAALSGAVIYGATKHLKWKPTPNESMFLNRMGWMD